MKMSSAEMPIRMLKTIAEEDPVTSLPFIGLSLPFHCLSTLVRPSDD